MNNFASPLFEQVLVSAEQNVHLQDWTIDHDNLGIAAEYPFRISKHTLHGGRQEGVELVIVDTGSLKITLVPTRGMGILNVESGGLRFGWDSPVKEVIHPRHVNLMSRGGLGWLEGFNEWLVRCGLEFAGGPGKDSFLTNTGGQAEMDLTLHGKIANVPASELQVSIERQPPHRIRVCGRVHETMMYGPKLELSTEVLILPGATTFQIEDVITNHGGTEQEFEIIYHINFGAPLLGAGSLFFGAMKRVFPMNAHAARQIDSYASYLGPTSGFIEQVYCMQPIADALGRTTLMLTNPASDRAASLSFYLDELPCFTLWKNSNSVEEGYVTGLEPGTNFPCNRRLEREAGRLSRLRPGQSRRFRLDCGFHSGNEAIKGMVARIDSLQGARQTIVESQMPNG